MNDITTVVQSLNFFDYHQFAPMGPIISLNKVYFPKSIVFTLNSSFDEAKIKKTEICIKYLV